jgi:hypothetical protein
MTITSSRVFSVCANNGDKIEAETSTAKHLVTVLIFMSNPSEVIVTTPNSPNSARIVLQHSPIAMMSPPKACPARKTVAIL